MRFLKFLIVCARCAWTGGADQSSASRESAATATAVLI